MSHAPGFATRLSSRVKARGFSTCSIVSLQMTASATSPGSDIAHESSWVSQNSISGGSPGYLTASTPIHFAKRARRRGQSLPRPHPTSISKSPRRFNDSTTRAISPCTAGSLSPSLCRARATASSKVAGCCNSIGFTNLLESFDESVHLLNLPRRVAHRARPDSTGIAEPFAFRAVSDQSPQAFGDGRTVSARHANPASLVDDFPKSTKVRSYYRQACVKRFGEYHRQPFETGVRLTIDVGGGQDSRHVRALSDEAHAIADSRARHLALQRFEQANLMGPLRATYNPALPALDVAQMRQRLQMNILALPFFEAAGLHRYDRVVGSIELRAHTRSFGAQ